ncbi:TetR/AcrR family transcriptional regulator [Paracoccus aurantiacus]|uniref:TetR/AcrR family transcriptional regulator n=1 Tax=Paracoccus aurantiacus TaxID=2599412 RepID=A0A5C6S0G4_9RHOB|nr:TetR/AcrR family transcriptional regulator [Paracoccus aurantiacus]TXB67755.1 TetR/AcrR family transcriptional regulator [Paracoccus aurantiacus]
MPADPKPYHHGNLIPTLIETTIDLIEERGVEKVTVREVAKRSGVSPGAPFRHFKSKSALMTAVAEQAMERLFQSVTAAQDPALEGVDPLGQLERIGLGYLSWVRQHPTHFQIVSNRKLIDFQGSDLSTRLNAQIRARMVALLEQARDNGQLAPGQDIETIVVTCRAMVYGLSRMYVDGHFPDWQPVGDPFEWMEFSLSNMINRMRTEPRVLAPPDLR